MDAIEVLRELDRLVEWRRGSEITLEDLVVVQAAADLIRGQMEQRTEVTAIHVDCVPCRARADQLGCEQMTLLILLMLMRYDERPEGIVESLCFQHRMVFDESLRRVPPNDAFSRTLVNAAPNLIAMAIRCAEAEQRADFEGRVGKIASDAADEAHARIATLERELAEARRKVAHFLRVYHGSDGGDTDEAINDAVDALGDVVAELRKGRKG